MNRKELEAQIAKSDGITSVGAAAAIEEGEFHLDRICQRVVEDREQMASMISLATSPDEASRLISEDPTEAAEALKFFAQVAVQLAVVTGGRRLLEKDRRS